MKQARPILVLGRPSPRSSLVPPSSSPPATSTTIPRRLLHISFSFKPCPREGYALCVKTAPTQLITTVSVIATPWAHHVRPAAARSLPAVCPPKLNARSRRWQGPTSAARCARRDAGAEPDVASQQRRFCRCSLRVPVLPLRLSPIRPTPPAPSSSVVSTKHSPRLSNAELNVVAHSRDVTRSKPAARAVGRAQSRPYAKTGTNEVCRSPSIQRCRRRQRSNGLEQPGCAAIASVQRGAIFSLKHFSQPSLTCPAFSR